MRAKSFFYACLGVLALALAYHLGASTATAQAPGNPVVAVGQSQNGGGWLQPIAITSNGNAYRSDNNGVTWSLVGNVFSGGPTPAQRESMGQLKVRYR